MIWAAELVAIFECGAVQVGDCFCIDKSPEDKRLMENGMKSLVAMRLQE